MPKLSVFFFFFFHTAIFYARLLAKKSTQMLIAFFFAFDVCHVISITIQCCSKQILVLIVIAAGLKLNPGVPALFIKYLHLSDCF